MFMTIRQLVPEKFVPRSPFTDDREPVKVENANSDEGIGLVAFTWEGWVGDLRWFGRLKYGQQLRAAPGYTKNSRCTITNGQAVEWLNMLDELLQVDGSGGIYIQQTTDKYSFFTDLLKWARKHELLSSTEAHALMQWLAMEELC